MQKLQNILLPPWPAFPDIDRYSIGWRMGSGEDYIMKWSDWYDKLTPEEEKEYQQLFPEPATWKGYWEDEDECAYYENGDFIMELWQDGGIPRYSVEWLRKACQRGETFTYFLFWGHRPPKDGGISKSCFSQWWKASFRSEESIYGCMEQYMMAKKRSCSGMRKYAARSWTVTIRNGSNHWGGKYGILTKRSGMR